MPVNLKGKDYSTYSEVLSEAHKRGLVSLESEMIMSPFEPLDNPCGKAIFKATAVLRVKDEDGEPHELTFTSYGDATTKNVGAMIAPHLLRMADTRAKGRALRDAVNAKTLIEELHEN